MPTTTLRSYLILARIQTAGLTMLTGVFGLLCRSVFSPLHLLTLGTIGLAAHLHGFIYNEIIDRRCDGASPHVAGKPLASGAFPLNKARLAAWLPAMVAYILIAVVYPNIWMWLLFLAGHLGEKLYNIHGKKVPGLDLGLALWAFTFCLFGYLAPGTPPLWHGPTPIAFPEGISLLCLAIAGLGGLQLLFNNSVEGGIKDCETDRRSGARTLAVVMGARVRDGVLQPGLPFLGYAWTIKILAIGLAWWTWRHFGAPGSLVPMLALTITALITLARFTLRPRFERRRLKRLFSIHEMATYMFVPLLLQPSIGTTAALGLLFFPIAWFLIFNRSLHGTWLVPPV
ncbi:UbiA family prenyltransferase [bacterium]|nr:UbiA family prenyltransferase [candidate division CSSED10-310 bacterium]